MYESSIVRHFTERGIRQGVQQGIQQGVQQGERKNAIEALLEVLEIRFQAGEVQTLKARIETIDDLQHLKQLLRAAVQVSSLEEFRHLLEANQN